VRQGGLNDLVDVEPLWKAMLDHHRVLTGGTLPVRGRDESWLLRREEYARGRQWDVVLGSF